MFSPVGHALGCTWDALHHIPDTSSTHTKGARTNTIIESAHTQYHLWAQIAGLRVCNYSYTPRDRFFATARTLAVPKGISRRHGRTIKHRLRKMRRNP